MQIRDLVNRAVTSIENCASEPIHIPGSIQPHGALIAVNNENFHITYCSANTNAFTGLEPANLLGMTISEPLPQLAAALENIELPEKEPAIVDITISGRRLQALVHASDGNIIIEIEQRPEEEKSGDIHRQTAEFINQIEQSGSLQELSQQIASQVRTITGYDRVMIYCFDKEYNGQVFAESRADDMEPFLGLHYPHTDIPPQARELYLSNLVRLIADVGYEPVPLLTVAEGPDQTLDLSGATLRSVSPIHIQYLKNMRVGGTLTISLILEGRLWGLIACHHREPLWLSYQQRQTTLMQGYFLTSQIRVRQVAEEYDVNVACEAHLQQLLNKIGQEEDFSLKFEQFTSLTAVANATGVVIMHNSELFEKGSVPPPDHTRALIAWLAANISSVQYSTSFLKSKYPDAEKISRYAAGIIYHHLGKPTENCIIWFRQEVERTIKWAGNPHEPVKKDPVKNMLMPRSSFAAWKQQVRWHSKEWRISEINAASRFATSLQSYFHMLHLRGEEARQRLLNEKLRKANEELANINWITTHDLKEPIRKIQVFASKVLNEEAQVSEQILTSINKIQQSATRMRVLVDDILNYSIVSGNSEQNDEVDLNRLIGELGAELSANPENVGVNLHAEELPIVNGVPFQLRQLFDNLLNNAFKFRKPGGSATVKVTADRISGAAAGHPVLDGGKTYHRIILRDDGIGFDSSQQEKVFQIFYRLHDKTIYSGTGIGLAICRKIAENHGGTITANASPGSGAAFSVYLPE